MTEDYTPDENVEQVENSEGLTEVIPEAPQNAGPTPVTVAPDDQSGDNKVDTIHGVEYNVTPDRGYRKS